MKEKRLQWEYLLGDLIIGILAMFCAVLLRLEGQLFGFGVDIHALLLYLTVAPLTLAAASFALGTYNSIWAYMGFSDVFRQFFSSAISALCLLLLRAVGLLPSGTIPLIYLFLVFCATTGLRIIPRFRHWMATTRHSSDKAHSRAVIVGAGSTGAMLIKRLCENPGDGTYPVAACDADTSKHGMRIAGVPIVGDIDRLAAAVRKYNATDVIIAIPSIRSEEVREIYDICKTLNVRLRIFKDAVNFESFMNNGHGIRDVSIEDLLFRKNVSTDMSDVIRFINGKTILVTGGAGSIGSELCRQSLLHGCKKLIIFDIHENGLFEINEEFKQRFDTSRYELILGSIRDRKRLDQVIRQFKPDIVFHAAAHKHVPMMEINPVEAVKNNIFGTKNLLEACLMGGVSRFILISTDKAVNPTNIMGATKRMAELLVKSYAGCGCECAAVRFGNVLGSNGSVIPTFKKQIDAGGPVTVTHKDMTRYFMTIPEAVSLVMKAGTLARGGEIFVLDMGQPVKIYDLATNLIRLSGFEPGVDIQIVTTGLRPGEKLYEELVQDSESVDATSHEKIFVMRGTDVNLENFHDRLGSLERMAKGANPNPTKVHDLVFDIISQYGGTGVSEAPSK